MVLEAIENAAGTVDAVLELARTNNGPDAEAVVALRAIIANICRYLPLATAPAVVATIKVKTEQPEVVTDGTI